MKQYKHNSLTHTNLAHRFSLSTVPCITLTGTKWHFAEAVTGNYKLIHTYISSCPYSAQFVDSACSLHFTTTPHTSKETSCKQHINKGYSTKLHSCHLVLLGQNIILLQVSYYNNVKCMYTIASGYLVDCNGFIWGIYSDIVVPYLNMN